MPSLDQQQDQENRTAADARGAFFAKRGYRDKPIPDWAPTRLRLPAPSLPERPALVAAYWHAWEAAFEGFRRPPSGSGLVSNYLDPGCEGRLSMLAMASAVPFLDLAHDLVPGVQGLDNFYSAQHGDGEIARDLEPDGSDHEPWVNREGRPLFSRRTGRTVDLGRDDAGVPSLTLDGCAHPLLAWAERESYRQTGDAGRVAEVWEPLVQFHRAWRARLRHANGLYVSDWAAMENSPRNAALGFGVDTNAEVVLAARCLAELAPVAAREAENAGMRAQGMAARRAGAELAAEAEALGALIRERMWDEETGFFYDLRPDGSRATVPKVAAFWTLVAGVASPAQAARLAAWVEDPEGFGRTVPVPTLAARAAGFDGRGGYFRGGVFPPFVLMAVRGLGDTGHGELAHRVALRFCDAVAEVAQRTGAFWENYAPDEAAPGRPARPDVIGSGAVAGLLLLEQGVGLRANAPLRELRWTIRTTGACGCERYWFAGGRLDLAAEERRRPEDAVRVTVTSDKPITLRLRAEGREAAVRVVGRREITLP